MRWLSDNTGVGIGTLILGVAVAGLLSGQTAVAAEPGSIHRVLIEKFKFVPETLTIRPGDMVEWINRDIVPHTATARDKAWSTDKLVKGKTARRMFSTPGSTTYLCRYHPSMRGQIIVRK